MMAQASEKPDRKELTQAIKAQALKVGGDVVGAAPVERWDDYVPEGYRPYDILPNAKSVVVVGARGRGLGLDQEICRAQKGRGIAKMMVVRS
ncbi:MAG: hypothetical protein QF726_07820 [Alphaproteobacteria bacterium]|nr:hypothetical protein [Alphaproteobacteria bacterium]